MVEGKLADAMTALEALENEVNGVLAGGVDELVVYRWRPATTPDFPALWNWFPPDTTLDSDLAAKDVAMVRDTFYISAFVAVAHTDAQEEMARIELYADAFREVVDTRFNQRDPLNGTVTRAQRVGMRPVIDDFGGNEVLCIEFPLELWIQRILNPTT